MKRKDRAKMVDERIEDLIANMAAYRGDEEEFDTMVQDLRILVEIRDGKQRLDPNTILTTVGSLGLGAAILLAEIFGHSITSKAWSPAFLRIRN